MLQIKHNVQSSPLNMKQNIYFLLGKMCRNIKNTNIINCNKTCSRSVYYSLIIFDNEMTIKIILLS